MTKVLLVEDDQSIVKNLTLLLEREGYAVHCAHTMRDAMDQIQETSFDLLLLDVSLPDGNGYAICTAAKHQNNVPVIFLTASDDEHSVVTGLDLGADDYIAKPFRPMELMSRIKSVMRRYERTGGTVKIGDLHLDTVRGTVHLGEQEIFLSAMEYKLLLIFVNHRNMVLSRQKLLDEIYSFAGEFVSDNTLTVYIKRLREKIEKDPSNAELIVTVRGLGYRMEG